MKLELMPLIKNKKILLLIRFFLTALFLALIFYYIPLKEILTAISSSDILMIINAFLVFIVFIFLSSLQTKYLTTVQEMNMSVFEIIKIYFTTAFYSLFLPGSLSGGAVKWFKLSKYGSKSSAAAIIFFNRFLELLITAVLGILFLMPTLLFEHHKNFLIVLVILLLIMITGYLVLLNTAALDKLELLALRIPLYNFFKTSSSNFFGAVNDFKNLKLRQHFEILGIMLLYHIINLYSFYLLAISLNIHISFWVLGWIRSVIIIVSMIPISFSAFGIREAALIYLLGYYGVGPTEAVSLSFLMFSRNLAASIAGGIIEFKDHVIKKYMNVNRKLL